ncbi:MAG: ribbon-helix-helix protein, CopG family [Bacillota bacterium]
MVKYKLTNVRFTEEEHEALRHLAVSEGRSMADIVREAVSSYLEHKVGRTLTEDELANDPFFKVIGIGCSEGARGSVCHDVILYKHTAHPGRDPGGPRQGNE